MFYSIRTQPNLQNLLKKEFEYGGPPHKYSTEGLHNLTNRKIEYVLAQARLADAVQDDALNVIDEVNEVAKDFQRDVQHRTRERIEEIEFLCDELAKQKKIAMLEKETLTTYRERVKKTLDFLNGRSYSICQQCIDWRDKRLGVDLCNDDVDRQLRNEIKAIKGTIEIVGRTLKESDVILRQLSAAIVKLDEDLEFKQKASTIDKQNSILRESSEPSVTRSAQNFVDLSCHYSLAEWKEQTYKNIRENSKELTSASQIRGYIDLTLRQVCEDMRNQTERTNLAFEKNISETKHAKKMLEDRFNEMYTRALDVEKIVRILQEEISQKEAAMDLCKTRINNRSLRPGIEMVCDEVQDSLKLELQALQVAICKLNQKLSENKAVQRYLSSVKVMLIEDINTKLNTIKIDEVDCMNLRLALNFTNF